jgi:hypothetical protein
MKRAVIVIGCLALLAGGSRSALAQSLEDIELKKAKAQRLKQEQEQELKKKKTFWKDFKFGFLGIVETATGVNADRPEVATLLWFAPQIKYKVRYRLQLNMGFFGYYLTRSTNPWDFTDWSLQASALNFWQDKKHTKIALSANLRYYLPLSIASRFNDRHGALRAMIKATRVVWKLYFGLELYAYYHFARYTTTDTAMVDPADNVVMTEGMVLSNTRATLSQRLIVAYTPWKRLTLSFLWTFYQMWGYQPRSAYQGVGSSLVTDAVRKNDVVNHSFLAIFDATFSVYKWFYIALGYSSFAPVQKGYASGVSWNPFDPLYGQVYLDLMMIY